MQRDSGIDWFIGLIGFGVTFGLAGLLEGSRSEVGSTNVALLLAAVVVVSGVLAQRRGALTTAGGAALSFNFFHTEPVHSLRIASGRDITTVVLLLVIGLVVGELSRHLRLAATGTRVGRVELDLLHDSAELASSRPAHADVVFHTTAAIAQLLGAEAVMFEPHPTTNALPSGEITHRGTTEGITLRSVPDGYDLGGEPIRLRVADGAVLHGHMIITPEAGRPVSLDARVGAVILADHLALALSSAANTRRGGAPSSSPAGGLVSS